MSSRSETGHAKNVSNFSTLIIILKEFGEKYNPSGELILPERLETLEIDCIAALNTIKEEQPVYMRALSARDELLLPIGKLSRRAVNFLKSTGAPQKTIDAAKSLSDKINGTRKKHAKPEEPGQETETDGKSPREISTAQTSMDSRIDNFDKLVKLLEETPEYKPNEEEMKTESLVLRHAEIMKINKITVEISYKMSNLRAVRDKLLYDEKLGLVATVSAIKAYLRYVFDINSSEYRQVTALKFSSPR